MTKTTAYANIARIKSPNTLRMLLLAGSALSVMGANSVFAQDAGASGTDQTDIQTVVVTATKRGASTLKEVPIAIQAFTAQDLAAKGAADFSGFYHSVPGLAVSDQGPGDKRYILRGINATGSGTIGLYLDEVIVTGENNQDGGGQQPDIRLFDINRVEILKGPQGTTFGSSSTSGTIRYITNKPNVDAFGGSLSTALKATDGANVGLQTDAAVNLPIVPGKFAVRIAGFYADLPGYIDNRFEKGVNNDKTNAARISARWNITEDLTLDAMAMTQNTHQDGKSYYNSTDYAGAALPKDYQADEARAPWDEAAKILNATLEYKRPYGTFTATASSFKRDTEFDRDASLAADAFLGLAYDGAGRSQLNQTKHREVDSFEARFASSWSGPTQILVGAFAQNETRDFRSYWPTVNAQGYATADSSLFLDRTLATKIKEQALFGEVNYSFTDALKLTVGARAFNFDLTDQAESLVGFGGGAGSGAAAPRNAKDNGITGRFNLAYKVTDNINTYVQVAQGYRSGGTNDQVAAEIANVTIPDGYASDSLINYETGIKSSFFNNKLYIDGALYYIDWSDIQVQAQATNGTASFPYTTNGGKASVTGLELEAELRPIKGLRISATGNYSDAHLTEDNPIVSTGRNGDAIPFVPKYTFSGGVDYRFPVDAWGMIANIGGDVSYTGERSTRFNSGIDNYHVLKAYSLLSLRASLKKDDWTVSLIGDNLLNDRTTIDYNEIVPGVYPDGYYTSRPRTITLTLAKSF